MIKKLVIIVICIIALVIIIIFVGNKKEEVNPVIEETPVVEKTGNVYQDNELGLVISLPVGWVAKPYPIDSTTIFISPVDFEFPDAWGGPLTPVTVMLSEGGDMEEMAKKRLEGYGGSLVLTREKIQGLQAIRVKGVPSPELGYIGGRYVDSVYLSQNNRVLDITYYADDNTPEYQVEFDQLIKTIQF